MPQLRETLFSRTAKTLRQTPKEMVALGFGLGLLVAAFDAAETLLPPLSKPTLLIGTGAIFLSWMIAQYVITMAMVDRPRSILGLARFMGASITRYSIILVALLIVFAFPTALQGTLGLTILIFILIGCGLVVTLTAWPLEQSQSPKFVSPWRALKATRGHRWTLFTLTGLATGLSRFVPTSITTHDYAQLALDTLEKTAIYGGSNILIAAVAASAFIFAIRNDPLLVGDHTAIS